MSDKPSIVLLSIHPSDCQSIVSKRKNEKIQLKRLGCASEWHLCELEEEERKVFWKSNFPEKKLIELNWFMSLVAKEEPKLKQQKIYKQTNKTMNNDNDGRKEKTFKWT